MGKIGDGHLSAMARMGLHELRGAVYPDSNVAQSPEYGLYGTKTPGEIAEARDGDSNSLEPDKGSASVVGDRLRESAARDYGHYPPSMEMDR
jgi:hypothetical protein